MKILQQEMVTRYEIEFDDDETDVLQAIGHLPPWAKRPARLWVTGDELEFTRTLLEKPVEFKLPKTEPV